MSAAHSSLVSTLQRAWRPARTPQRRARGASAKPASTMPRGRSQSAAPASAGRGNGRSARAGTLGGCKGVRSRKPGEARAAARHYVLDACSAVPARAGAAQRGARRHKRETRLRVSRVGRPVRLSLLARLLEEDEALKLLPRKLLHSAGRRGQTEPAGCRYSFRRGLPGRTRPSPPLHACRLRWRSPRVVWRCRCWRRCWSPALRRRSLWAARAALSPTRGPPGPPRCV